MSSLEPMTVCIKEESDFAFEKEGTLILLVLRQEDKPFDIVPGSSDQQQPSKSMWWAVYNNLSQIPPQ